MHYIWADFGNGKYTEPEAFGKAALLSRLEDLLKEVLTGFTTALEMKKNNIYG